VLQASQTYLYSNLAHTLTTLLKWHDLDGEKLQAKSHGGTRARTLIKAFKLNPKGGTTPWDLNS